MSSSPSRSMAFCTCRCVGQAWARLGGVTRKKGGVSGGSRSLGAVPANSRPGRGCLPRVQVKWGHLQVPFPRGHVVHLGSLEAQPMLGCSGCSPQTCPSSRTEGGQALRVSRRERMWAPRPQAAIPTPWVCGDCERQEVYFLHRTIPDHLFLALGGLWQVVEELM